MKKFVKKFAWGCLLLVLVIGAVPSLALGERDLSALAKYAPASTLLYASVRSDDDYVAIVDALAEKIATVAPLGLPEGGIKGVIDEALQPLGGYDATREWVGDTIALAQFGLAGSPTVIIAISDIDKATEAVNRITELADNFKMTETSSGLLFTSGSSALLLTADALLIEQSFSGEFFASLPTESESLANDATFQSTLAQLPAESYNAVVYAQVIGVLTMGLTMDMPSGAEMDPLMGTLVRYTQGLGATAVGFTIVDERNLVVDIVQTVTDSDALAPILPFFTRPAVSLDFAQNIPSDAQLLIHSTDFGTVRQLTFDLFKSLGEYIDTRYEEDTLPSYRQQLMFVDDILTFIELSFKGMTGQPMSEAFGWMTGDFAVYNSFAFADNKIGIEANMSVANSDTAQATRFVDGIAQLLDDTNIPYARENDTLTLTSLTELANVASTSPLPIAENNLDVVLGANDSVLTFGTYPTANRVLKGDFVALADDSTFQNVASWVLPNANTVLYVNVASLNEFANTINPNMSDSPLSLFESASGSVATSNTAVTVRLVLTLK
jgi:hypothetical protein